MSVARSDSACGIAWHIWGSPVWHVVCVVVPVTAAGYRFSTGSVSWRIYTSTIEGPLLFTRYHSSPARPAAAPGLPGPTWLRLFMLCYSFVVLYIFVEERYTSFMSKHDHTTRAPRKDCTLLLLPSRGLLGCLPALFFSKAVRVYSETAGLRREREAFWFPLNNVIIKHASG